MEIEEMTAFPPNSNPFVHDHYHMGTTLGSNVLIMHENHTNKDAQYLIIVHKPTGQRLRIILPEFAERTAMHPDICVAMHG